MAGSIPNVEEERIAADYIRNDIELRLFSNNVTPGETTTLAAFNQVAGGGYAAKTLSSGNWVSTQGNPTEAEYPEEEFEFTSTTTAPGTIYGYYLVDTVTGLYIGGERFASAVTPMTPGSGSKIRITLIVQVS